MLSNIISYQPIGETNFLPISPISGSAIMCRVKNNKVISKAAWSVLKLRGLFFSVLQKRALPNAIDLADFYGSGDELSPARLSPILLPAVEVEVTAC